MLLREFKELRWQRPPSFDEFKADVRSAAKRGYATDIDSYVTGVTTIASAINNAEGNAVMAISAIGFSGQFTDEMIERVGQSLRKRAAVISRSLSGGDIAASRDATLSANA